MNTIILSLDNLILEDEISKWNRIFTYIFIMEMGIKLISLGHKYFLDKMNIFDCLLVIISIEELFKDTKKSAYTAFRFNFYINLFILKIKVLKIN